MAKKIPLTKGGFVVVDEADFVWLSQYNWHRDAGGYARRTIRLPDGKYTAVLMHRVIIAAPPGIDVDHKDSDQLNNQKSNLRLCTKSQNLWNTKKRKDASLLYKGIGRKKGGFRARCTANGKRKTKGPYKTQLRAAHAYDEMAREMHGEFAKLNFPDEQDPPLSLFDTPM